MSDRQFVPERRRSVGRPARLALMLLPVLAACSTAPEPPPGEAADRIIADDAARAAAAQPLENTYPSVREVPPRPKLSYTAAQRRQIQDGLTADLAHAKRTAELVRTTEGASPPPMPPVPEVVPDETSDPAPAVVRRRAPAKVILIERRDTSGDLSTFLDDVMADDPQSEQIRPSLVPSPRSTATSDAVEDGNDSSLAAGMSGFFGDDVVTATGSQDAPVAAAAPAESGRRWLFPLADGRLAPSTAAMQPMLDELVGTGALTGRRLLVIGRSADAGQAERRAAAMADLLARQGIPAERIEQRQDATGSGEAVDVRVLEIAAPGG